MRTALAQRLLVGLALLATCLSAIFPGGGVVLCLESDGHVTLERAGAGCSACCSDSAAEQSVVREAGACACVDLTLVGTRLPFAKVRASECSGSAPPPPAGIALSAWHAPRARYACAEAPGGQRSAPVTLLSSVVLRV